MPFITKADFPTALHNEILNSLTRGDDEVIAESAEQTVEEMKAYLNGRYDIQAIFDAVGEERNKFLLRIGLSLTKYYIFLQHNPRKITEVMVAEYDRAIETLEGIQSGKVNPAGLPLPPAPPSGNANGAPIQWGGDTQLGTNW